MYFQGERMKSFLFWKLCKLIWNSPRWHSVKAWWDTVSFWWDNYGDFVFYPPVTFPDVMCPSPVSFINPCPFSEFKKRSLIHRIQGAEKSICGYWVSHSWNSQMSWMNTGQKVNIFSLFSGIKIPKTTGSLRGYQESWNIDLCGQEPCSGPSKPNQFFLLLSPDLAHGKFWLPRVPCCHSPWKYNSSYGISRQRDPLVLWNGLWPSIAQAGSNGSTHWEHTERGRGWV